MDKEKQLEELKLQLARIRLADPESIEVILLPARISALEKEIEEDKRKKEEEEKKKRKREEERILS